MARSADAEAAVESRLPCAIRWAARSNVNLRRRPIISTTIGAMRAQALVAALAFAALVAACGPRPAAREVAPQKIPFSSEENRDGARFIWFLHTQTGFPYAYIPARDFPASSEFAEVPRDSARSGDVAWWSDFVGLFGGWAGRTVILVNGPVPLDQLVKKYGAEPRFFRKAVRKQ